MIGMEEAALIYYDHPNGVQTGLYDAEKLLAGFGQPGPAPAPYAALCRSHQQMVYHHDMLAAEKLTQQPGTWCPGCKAGVPPPAGPLPVAPDPPPPPSPPAPAFEPEPEPAFEAAPAFEPEAAPEPVEQPILPEPEPPDTSGLFMPLAEPTLEPVTALPVSTPAAAAPAAAAPTPAKPSKAKPTEVVPPTEAVRVLTEYAAIKARIDALEAELDGLKQAASTTLQPLEGYIPTFMHGGMYYTVMHSKTGTLWLRGPSDQKPGRPAKS